MIPIYHAIGHGPAAAPGEVALWIVAAVLLIVFDKASGALDRAREWLELEDAEESPEDQRIAEVWERWYAGEITHADAEARVGTILDPPTRELRESLEAIDSIGPETSLEVAREFRTLEELRSASRGELEEIDGVGPERAELLAEA